MPLITNQVMGDIIGIIGQVVGKSETASKLKPRSDKEPPFPLSQKGDSKTKHTGVEIQYDGRTIMFNLMLSHLN